MPGLDRSGPSAMGEMTGRGAGLCNRHSMQANSNVTGGLGRGAAGGCRRAGGFGQGACRGAGGRGAGNPGFAAAADEERLKARREQLRRSLAEVENLLGVSE